MCGINGMINGKKLDEKLEGMNYIVRKRGPDGQNIVSGEDFALGHTRLAIVDADNSGADQPMVNERYILTYNGEIYNHKELRKQLEKLGVSFRTDCDTEVILEGFGIWKEKLLDKLNGQFAFAIYDKETKETFLARDRTAMKPLYYSLDDSELIFSSDPKAVSLNIGFKPNLESIASLYTSGFIFASGEEPLGSSTYEGIKSLNPGEYIRFSDDSFEKRKYFALSIKDIENPRSEQEFIDELSDKLTGAIKKRIPDEVKLGCALSGGLDSSIITAITADNCGSEVIASCIRYTADPHNPDYDHAKILADSRDNIKLLSADLSPENFLDDLEEMVEALGIHDSIRQLAMFRNYAVLKKQGVKVVLTGEGADEFNWGYWHKLPGLKVGQDECSTEDKFRELVSRRKEFVEQLISADVDFDKGIDYLTEMYDNIGSTDSTRKMMGIYAIDFLGFLNKANDRCAMAHSLEARCPYQDVELIEMLVQIPREYQIKGDGEKHILREAFKDVVPYKIYKREKAPLPAASHIDYHKAIAEEFDKRIQDVDNSFWDYFSKDSFGKISDSYRQRIADLETTHQDMSEAGAKLMEWRPINEKGDILSAKQIRSNDVFKLLTTMVWYDQNTRNMGGDEK